MNRFARIFVVSALASFSLLGCNEEEPVMTGNVSAARVPGEPPPMLLPRPGSSGGPPAAPWIRPGSDLAPVGKPDEAPSTPVQSPRPYATNMPPARPPTDAPRSDETVSGIYKASDGNIVEVEGVCKITEDSIVCWKPDGRPNEELAKKIKEGMEKSRPSGYSPSQSFSLQYGKKNRLVVLKLTQPVNATGAHLDVRSIGSDSQGGGGYFNAMLSPSHVAGPNQPYIHFESRMIAENPSEKAATAHLNFFRPIQESVRIVAKAGTSATFGGENFTIARIDKGSPQNLSGGQPETIWTVTVRSDHNGARGVNIALVPLDASGQRIDYIDADGNPVTREVYDREMQQRRETMGRSGYSASTPPKYQPATLYGISRQPYQTDFMFRINPAKVSKFAISGGTVRYIDLTGIALDPK